MFPLSCRSVLGRPIAVAILSLFLTGQALADGQISSLPNPTLDTPLAKTSGQQTAVLAGGCFWGVQLVFQHVKGVISATSGYAGGPANEATYSLVSTGTTGHAESVRVVYDPAQITYGQLLKVFFSVALDPTELNRQGPDVGTQYRSEIFAVNTDQKKIAEAYISQLSSAKVYPRKIVTEVMMLPAFYPAETYHQNYAKLHPHNPYIVINDLPKITHLKAEFPAIYR